MTPLQGALVLGAGWLSWFLTDRVRRYAIASALLDIPNERSAHDRPVPRGGGLAIVVVTLTACVAAAALGWLGWTTAIALLGGLPVAAIGWMDDRRDQSAAVRVLVHTAAAAWAAWQLDGLPSLLIGDTIVTLGVAGTPLAIIGLVAATNFFNFMDGIDGIAAGEACVAGGIAGALLVALGFPGLGFMTLVIAAASGGFLVWNRSPARIFMGDIGSGFLGFVLGVLALASERAGALPLLLWALILGVFIFDPLVTVLRRLARGERPHEAHRSHAYQRAVQSGVSHGRVSALTMLTTVALGALATVGAMQAQLSSAACVAGIVLLSVLYLAVERRRPMSAPRHTSP